MNVGRGKGRHGWLVYILRNDIRLVCSKLKCVLTILVHTNPRTSLDSPASDRSPPGRQNQGQTTPHRMEMQDDHTSPKTPIKAVQTAAKNSLYFALQKTCPINVFIQTPHMKTTLTTPSVIPSPPPPPPFPPPPGSYTPLSHFPSFHRPLVFPGKKTAFPPREYVSDGTASSAPSESLRAAFETTLCSFDFVGWVDCFCASAFSAARESKEVVESRRAVMVMKLWVGLHRVVWIGYIVLEMVCSGQACLQGFGLFVVSCKNCSELYSL